jgi:hypothetical protein
VSRLLYRGNHETRAVGNLHYDVSWFQHETIAAACKNKMMADERTDTGKGPASLTEGRLSEAFPRALGLVGANSRYIFDLEFAPTIESTPRKRLGGVHLL